MLTILGLTTGLFHPITTGGRQTYKLGGVTEDLDVAQMPQQEGPELRLELRQLGSGISIMCVCVSSSVGVRMCESQHRFDQVQLLSMLTGEDGGFLVVLHQLIHGAKLALADTVHPVRLLHFKVLILTGCLQRHREIIGR